MERVLHQTEQECSLKITVAFGKTRKWGAYFGGVSIGFPLTRSQNLSKRVCGPCGPKIRNAAELSNFIEKAVSAKPEEDFNREADFKDRAKRGLPTTVHRNEATQNTPHRERITTVGKARELFQAQFQ